MKKIILITLVCFLFYGCPTFLDTINFVNQSDYTVYFNASYHYPDTLSIKLFQNNGLKIGPNEKGGIDTQGRWEEVISSLEVPSDTLMIYIFNADFEGNPDYVSILKRHILQRYDLSLQDLKNLNWTLYYLPTEAMKHIKMYPPYESAE